MAGYDREIISGTPGTVWTNDTGKPRYQFIASLVNTCGVCWSYHLKIGPFWPIPIHWGCRCRQAVIQVGADAPHPFCDFRALLDGMPLDQQKAAVGASNWRLLESGVVEWKDVVTPARVRDFREVVALKKLSVKTLTDAGVKPIFAEAAHAAVHTQAHQLAAAQRAAQEARLKAAGMNNQQLAAELAKRLGERISLQSVPTLAGTTTTTRLIGAGGSTAAQLRKLLSLATITTAAMGPKPKKAVKLEAAPSSEQVLDAARRVPAERLFGDHKAWIHDVWEEYRKVPGAANLTLEAFKRYLVEDPETRMLLARADLIQAMDPADVARSNATYEPIPGMVAVFNFVRRK
jgi:hypothetical protein